MFDTDDIPSNPTANPHLIDLIDQQVSRRSVLKGAAAASMLGFLGSTALSSGTVEAARRPLLGFSEIPPSSDDTIHVPAGYTWEVLVPWGTPLVSGVTFAEAATNSAADQRQQVGFNHDGMWYFALPNRDGRQRGLLCINHEYTDANQIYSAAQGSTITADAAGVEKVDKALAGHGVTVVEVRQQADGSWSHVVGSRFNRRITGTTPMAFSGPVSPDNPMLASSITPAPLGTLNNCANGYTPWGTYLTCEENWNGYFGTANNAWTATALESRYGVSKAGFGYSWHIASTRFDLDVNRNEVNHFGWVVEIDPKRPASTPVKRSALGRIKHEGATAVTATTGEVVVYMGDDENGEYFYKFVGDRPWAQYIAEGESPLDHGTLYVAKFDALGGGQWLPLVHGEAPFTVDNGWDDQAEVL
ncbi:MAG: PhoX family protein, partial [Ilumatobacteraceae bacterium]